MTSGDELFVTIGGRDVGLAQVLARVDQEMQQSANNAVRLGQQYARLAQAQGQPTAASEILAGTMQRAGSASESALLGISTQAARLGSSSQGLGTAISGLGGQLSQLGGTAGQLGGQLGALAGGLGALGGIGAVLGLGKAAIDLSVVGANADLVRQRFDGLAESAGTTGQALIGALRSASGGEINDLNLQLAANRAQLLGVADSAEEFSTLMGIARDRAQQLGGSATKAFDDLVTGLGRGSPLILDNLGIIVSVKEANDRYAASLGTTASALTEAQQKQALINAVLEQGRASLAASGGAIESNAGTYARFNTTVQNVSNSLGSAIATGFAPYAKSIADAGDATGQFIGWLQGLSGATAQSANAIQAHAAGQAAYNAAIASGASATQAAAAFQSAYAAAQAQGAAASAQGATAFDAYRTAALAGGAALDQARAAIAQVTGEIDKNAQAAVLAAAQQQAQGQATAALTAETNAAVTAFLNLNPNLDAAGIASAIAAGKVPPFIGQLAALRQQALETGAALSQLSAQQAGIAGIAKGLSLGANNRAGALSGAGSRLTGGASGLLAQNEALAQSERDLALARAGSAAEQIRLLQAQADKTLDLTEKNRLLIRIEGLKDKGRGSGGAGGGARLSDQQKLENQLLSSQDQFANKSEDAERQHTDRLLDIQADFARRMLDAQQSFGQSQLEGRAGFYDSLGNIEDQGLRQSLAAQYEAAFQEADQIARERGADVGQAFLEAKQQALGAQAQRASEISKAQSEGDQGKAEYLAGVDRLYREAEDRKLATIKEGKDSLATQQQQQVDEESAKYQDAQDKLGLSSERAADRAITAAERRGQAIDAEALKVGGLADQYAKIGGAPGGTAAAQAGGPLTATPPPPAASTAGAAAPIDIGAALASLAGKIDELRGALVAAEKAGADQIASSVRGLSGVVR